jgi:hypothetical protein
MKPPTRTEIVKARAAVERRDGAHYPGKLDGIWQGDGWHEDEIYFGILIGLQIGEERARNQRKSNANSGRG